MQRLPIVTLTTDFGRVDSFVGQMKGAALAIEPGLTLVDLCHEVPAQDVAAGAYLLETGYAAFPPGTIHVAVVDPGVGSARSPILLRTPRYRFVGPDNGLFARVLEREELLEARELREASLRRSPVSPTFEGRDVFAPAAAWLARGVPAERFGPSALPLRTARAERPAAPCGTPFEAPVVHVDRFGNVVLDVRAAELEAALGKPLDASVGLRLEAPTGPVTTFRTHYAAAPDGEPFLLVNSAGYLELAVDRGRADERLGLRRGDHPSLRVGA